MTERERFESYLEELENENEIEIDLTEMEIAWHVWQAARRWISVKEELPEEAIEVLVLIKRKMVVAYRLGDYWWMVSSEGTHPISTPTHWQPLPELPEEKKRSIHD